MRVLPDLPPIDVHKSLGVTQTSAEERLELVPYDRGSAVGVVLPLVLLPTEADSVPKEGRSKKNLIGPPSSSGGKVVLTLLTKVVAFHMGIFAMHVRGMGFQGFIPRLLEGGGRSSLQDGLKNLLQVFLGVVRNRECSGRDDSNGKVCPKGSSRLVRQVVVQLRRRKGVRGSNGGSDRGMLPVGTSAASD